MSDEVNAKRGRWGRVWLADIDSNEFRSLRGAEVRVYLTLATFADDGLAWPRQQTLARITGMRSEHVSRSIARLMGAGLVRRTTHPSDPRRARYELVPPPSRRGGAGG